MFFPNLRIQRSSKDKLFFHALIRRNCCDNFYSLAILVTTADRYGIAPSWVRLGNSSMKLKLEWQLLLVSAFPFFSFLFSGFFLENKFD